MFRMHILSVYFICKSTAGGSGGREYTGCNTSVFFVKAVPKASMIEYTFDTALCLFEMVALEVIMGMAFEHPLDYPSLRE